MLEADSIKNPMIEDTKKKPQSKAKTGVRQLQNSPITLQARKVKMPKETSFYRPGVVLPVCKTRLISNQPHHISYTDFQTATKMITSGDISIRNVIDAQKADQRLSVILNLPDLPTNFKIIENLLYHRKKDHYRLALPEAFLDPLINAKHYTAFGIHLSKARIKRDLQNNYFVNTKALNEKLDFLKENCIICQFNQQTPKQHPIQQSNLIFSPRTTWSCDIIPSLPKSENGYTAIFLAVDMYTGYIQLCPIKSRQTSELIEAVTRCILTPFSTPKYFRCDSETGMFSSTEFFKFMNPLGIEFLPCSTGAPWSNGAAERAVQTIKSGLKKFLQQEHTNSKWDEYIHFFCSSHNKSTSVYGHSPETLMFGFLNPNPSDLFQIWPNEPDVDKYISTIVHKAEKARQETREVQTKRFKQNLTYRNQNLHKKKFREGDVVLQRQLQLATGPGKAMQPSYQGPYVIVEIDDDQSSALIQHCETKQHTRAHFSNITKLNYHPQHHKFPDKYDEQMLKFLPEKYTLYPYYPPKKEKPDCLQKDANKLEKFPTTSKLAEVNDEFSPDIYVTSDNFDIDDQEPLSKRKRNTDSNINVEKQSYLEDNLQDEFSNDVNDSIKATSQTDKRVTLFNDQLVTLIDNKNNEKDVKDKQQKLFVPQIISSTQEKEINSISSTQEREKDAKEKLIAPHIFSTNRNDHKKEENKPLIVPQIFSTNQDNEKQKKKKKQFRLPQIFLLQQKGQISNSTDPTPDLTDNANSFQQDSLRRSHRLKKPPDKFQANFFDLMLTHPLIDQKKLQNLLTQAVKISKNIWT
jgi:hypothetical protein